MNLKNYTSGYPAEKSISKIESYLCEMGANEILKEMANGKVTGIKFKIDGSVVALPANVQKVEEVIRKNYKRVSEAIKKSIKDQAERTAWKLLLDWVEIHCSMILMEQVKPVEVFLPYLWSAKNNSTFYQMVEAKGIPLMLEGKQL